MKKTRLVITVFFLHIAALVLFHKKEPPKKKLVVTEYRLPKKKPPKVVKKKVAKKKKQATPVKKKKTPKKKAVAPKKKQDNTQEIHKMLDSWDKIFTQPSAKAPQEDVILPTKITLDAFAYVQDDHYDKGLISYLEKEIILPEKGSIKIDLVISFDGKMKSFSILSTDSQRNENYLKKHLPTLTLPCFNKKENEKKFTLNFIGK